MRSEIGDDEGLRVLELVLSPRVYMEMEWTGLNVSNFN